MVGMLFDVATLEAPPGDVEIRDQDARPDHPL